MKSRISFFDKAVIRKDITRFAPLWAIYLIGGLMVMMTMVSGRNYSYAAQDLMEVIGPFSIINMIYAALCAQSLFGDLFNTRHCNALHALPLRRETWFVSHAVSGLLFSFVPHIIGALVIMVSLNKLWFVSLIWLLGMVLEYLFFFGLAVFSVFCTGNRFAMVAVYGILNFASMIAFWFVDTIYEPMLFGVYIQEDLFTMFCPLVSMCSQQKMVIFERGMDDTYIWQYRGLGEGWWYLGVCAVIGVGLLAASLLLYRCRKLECAGDFIAIKPLEPIFAVVFTVSVGCVFAVVEQMFSTDYLLFLCVGLVIGWFVGQMLLQRTVKVFKGKTFLKLAILLLALGASIFLTWLDPLGITRWVPKPENVAYVELGDNIYDDSYLKMDDRETVEDVTLAHKLLIEERSMSGTSHTVVFHYTMRDGRRISRTYKVHRITTPWNILSSVFSDPEYVLGYTDWEDFVSKTEVIWGGDSLLNICQVYARYSQDEVDYRILHDTMRRELLEALKKDCEKGLLPQKFVPGNFYQKSYIELEDPTGEYYRYRSIAVYANSSNTQAWLKKYEHVLKFTITSD